MTAAVRGAAIAGGCAAAAYTIGVVDAPPLPAGLAVTGAALVVAAAMAARSWPAWVGALLLGTAYVTAVALRGGDVDPGAPAVAAVLFLVVEAVELASSRGAEAVRLWHALALSFAAALLAGALLVAGVAFRTSGPLAVAASALCGAVLLSALAAFSGRRAPEDG